MSLPRILQPAEGRSLKIKKSTCTFKVTAKDTHGHFGLFEYRMASGAQGASPHIHEILDLMSSVDQYPVSDPTT